MESTKNKLLPWENIHDRLVSKEEVNPIDEFLYKWCPVGDEIVFREDLIKALNYETEEEKMFRNGEVVSSFMAHCEENGLEIPLSFYESYFGA